MIYKCKIECFKRELEELSIDSTIWLNFSLKLERIDAFKENRDGSTTVYISSDAFIIDTLYKEFEKIYDNFINKSIFVNN